ncbi:MAG: Xaa-Pro peptidase family protein [Planctomycetota bacterium]
MKQPTRRELLTLAAGGAAVGCSPVTNRDTHTADDDERFAARLRALPDRSNEVAAISDAERAARLERLRAEMQRQDLDAVVLEPGASLQYLSAVRWGRSERLFALVVLADDDPFWVVPAFEAPRAEAAIATGGPAGELLAWHEHEYAFAPLAQRLVQRGARRVAVDHQARVFVLDGLARTGALEVGSAASVLTALRGQKDEHEVRLLRLANELTQQALGEVATWLEPGLTDREVGDLVRRAQERLGLTDVWVLSLFDEGAALPHGRASGRVLEPGSKILIDTGGGLHGYQSDNTRTWIFEGSPDAEFQRAWDLVRRAQAAAFDAIRPGVPCREVDRAARAVIDAGGFGSGYEAFAHRLGHGIGLEGHEAPNFDGGSGVLLEPGMTFSDEPGIYLPGRFGIRIEDCVVVTEDGADHFGEWQRSPTSPDR